VHNGEQSLVPKVTWAQDYSRLTIPNTRNLSLPRAVVCIHTRPPPDLRHLAATVRTRRGLSETRQEQSLVPKVTWAQDYSRLTIPNTRNLSFGPGGDS
jgi:predicted restriction endonuclease